jgi:hypothetical protein
MLEKYSVNPTGDVAYSLKSDRSIVGEEALVNDHELITAVYKAVSRDYGKSWTGGTITADAEIFELGKLMAEQPFIARPISLNGKKIHKNPLPK